MRLPRTVVVLLAATTLAQAQLSFTFDYTYDTGGFFTGANAGRQAYLTAAGSYLSGYLSATTLSAIAPGGSNSWDSQPFDPRDVNASLSLGNITVAANTVVVYVGAYDLPGSTLGIGGPAGWSGSGNQAWFDTINYRGNGTASMTSVGSITFDSLTSWYFDSNIGNTESFPCQSDFFSVAVHELSHLLGFGTSTTWNGLVSGATFLGPASDALYGGAVPLDGGLGHWSDGTMSVIAGTATAQETAMDPSITIGTRKYLTALDVAGLQDIGYATAVPEPAGLALGFGLLALGWCAWRRRPGGTTAAQ